MSDVRPVAVSELRSVITDPSELAKGTEIADRGGLAYLSRHENKLFADASGSGASPYKVQLVFGDGKLTGRCSCMAARSRPYCKHAAALLVSWARTPEAFQVADAPPTPVGGAAKKTAVKRGTVDAKELRKKGVDQASTLLGELWQTGVMAIAQDRAGQVAELSVSLRELGLPRLAVRTLELSALLTHAARRDDSLSAEDYASAIADLWLTVRKLEKHLEGEAVSDEHVEQLIGRVWTKKDRKPIADLELLEYAFLQRTTVDGLVIRESRFLELTSGEHYAERQILPLAVSKRLPPKPSYANEELHRASGSVAPSFAPKRVFLDEAGTRTPLSQSALERALSLAIPDVPKALATLAERRRDVFAPPWVPVFLRFHRVVASGGRVRFVDRSGAALFLAEGREREAALMSALDGIEAVAVAGDVMLEGALPCLYPVAVLGRRALGGRGALALSPLGGDDAGALSEEPHVPTTPWVVVAKRAGVPASATLLGEVRDDLAMGFQEGYAGCKSTRFLDPLVARLTELSLAKQAEALRAVQTAPEPFAALDAMVKVYQVLGIALSRLVGTAPIDHASLVDVPSMPSVAIHRPAKLLAPDAAVASEARGELHAYERAYHVDVHFQAMGTDALLHGGTAVWGNGAAVPFVLAAAAERPEVALALARSMLTAETRRQHWAPTSSRLARLTAIRLLENSNHPHARQVLATIDRGQLDEALVARARRAEQGPLVTGEALEKRLHMVLAGSSKDDRALALSELALAAATEAIPVARAALRDRTMTVRASAAAALALLGDTLSLDTFVSWLEGDDHAQAKLGARCIGMLGDVRGGGALLAALARGFSPVVAREGLQLLGPWVLGPVLTLGEAQPELMKRASVGTLIGTFDEARSLGALVAFVDEAREDRERVTRRATLALDAASGRDALKKQLAAWLGEHHAAVIDADPTLKKKVGAANREKKPQPAAK